MDNEPPVVALRMQRKGYLIAAASIAATACATSQANGSPENAVWNAVETRMNSWVKDDWETYRGTFHPQYARWNRTGGYLETASDVSDFWHGIRRDERSVSINVEREKLIFLAEGRVAIAHYTINEAVEYIGEPYTQRGSRQFYPGDTAVYRARFSDIYELRDNRWQYIGGHRDGASLPDRGMVRSDCQKEGCAEAD